MSGRPDRLPARRRCRSWRQRRVVNQVDRLAESHARLAAAQQRTDEQLRATDEQLKATDARLDALIELFERQLREKHQPPPS